MIAVWKNIHPEFQLEGKPVRSITELFALLKDHDISHAKFLQEWFDDKSYIVARTSGSTGQPKEIQIKKVNLLNSARKTIDFFGLPAGTRALLNLSTDFIAGKLMWIRAITGGWHLDVSLPANKSITQKLEDNFYDFGAMVPLQVDANLRFIPHIKQIIIGGAAVSEDLQQKLYDLPTRIYATYGMTETLTHIAVRPINKLAEQNFYTDKIQYGAYRVLDGVQISTDERNCLIIDAPGITEQPVVTNDVVKIIDRKHFQWLGRYDNIINSGGVKLIPEQIEKKLSALISAPFFVAGLQDDKLGMKLVMLVESSPFDLPDFSQYVSKYEIPKQVYFVKKFQRTDSGKIQRAETLKKL